MFTCRGGRWCCFQFLFEWCLRKHNWLMAWKWKDIPIDCWQFIYSVNIRGLFALLITFKSYIILSNYKNGKYEMKLHKFKTMSAYWLEFYTIHRFKEFFFSWAHSSSANEVHLPCKIWLIFIFQELNTMLIKPMKSFQTVSIHCQTSQTAVAQRHLTTVEHSGHGTATVK